MRRMEEQEAIMTSVQDLMTQTVISVPSHTSIMVAAQRMNEKKTSSILVIDNNHLMGIVTERDMVARVVAKGVPLTDSVETIMTTEPITIPKDSYYFDALSLMLLNGIKHLPVVENDSVIGIVTLSDLLRKKNENVMKTLKQIDEAREESLASVKNAIYLVFDNLLIEKAPVFKTLDIITRLYDRLVVRIVNLAVESLSNQGYDAPGPFSFYQMGSSGRGEQFMLTDQDHFLVYQTDKDQYFQKLGIEITRLMEEAGYERCKGLMMCSEKQWRGSLSVWEDRLRTWSLQSTNENLLLAQNFFSYRFIVGSDELNHQFEHMIKRHLGGSKIFLYRLAQLERENSIPSLEQPIRSLLKLDRKSIDMKKSVLFPYHHSLQILALLHEIPSGTPLEKIDKLVEKGILSDRFSQDIKEAANQLLTLYVNHRWNQAKSGEETSSVFQVENLTSREKNELIWSLKTLRELQSQLFAHFSI